MRKAEKDNFKSYIDLQYRKQNNCMALCSEVATVTQQEKRKSMIVKSKVHGSDMVEPLGMFYFLECYELHFLKHLQFNFTLTYDTNLSSAILRLAEKKRMLKKKCPLSPRS